MKTFKSFKRELSEMDASMVRGGVGAKVVGGLANIATKKTRDLAKLGTSIYRAVKKDPDIPDDISKEPPADIQKQLDEPQKPKSVPSLEKLKNIAGGRKTPQDVRLDKELDKEIQDRELKMKIKKDATENKPFDTDLKAYRRGKKNISDKDRIRRLKDAVKKYKKPKNGNK